jgi:signal peptidase I
VAVKDIIIVVAGVAIVWLGLRLAFDTDNPFYVVSSGSMEPVLQVNDVLIVRDGGSFDDLSVGDIIVFNKPVGGDRVIVHRIVEIIPRDDGDSIIRTKGDANPSSIPGTDFPITSEDYIGKVIYVLPGIGLITKVISPPVNYIIIAIILAILFFNRMGKKSSSSTNSSSSNNNPSEPGTGASSSSSSSSSSSPPPSQPPSA